MKSFAWLFIIFLLIALFIYTWQFSEWHLISGVIGVMALASGVSMILTGEKD